MIKKVRGTILQYYEDNVCVKQEFIPDDGQSIQYPIEISQPEVFRCDRCKHLAYEEDSYYDAYYEERLCEDCWNERFGAEANEHNAEWFLKNYNIEEIRSWKDDFREKIGLTMIAEE